MLILRPSSTPFFSALALKLLHLAVINFHHLWQITGQILQWQLTSQLLQFF
ncbi:hypothetical protein PPRY_a2837 [Pseudoalteromonas prydzensis ACAM 620]|nr:hypothetical protein [Pseudoalteromonas prydzensis ACAM 620]